MNAPSLDAIADHTKTAITAAAIGVPHDVHEDGMRAARSAWHAAASNEASYEEKRAAAQKAYDEAIGARVPVASATFTDPSGASRTYAGGELTIGSRQIAPGEMDTVGLERVERDLAAARAAGFSPASTIYQRGLRVELGDRGVARSRVEFDSKPLVSEACAAFAARISAEQRRDVTVRAEQIGMTEDGELMIGEQVTARPSRSAFHSLVSRLGYGGAAYLAEKCPPVLRAGNVNAQRVLIAEAETERRFAEGAKFKPAELVLRQRTRAEERETFGVVSKGYAAFDADRVARSIARATPADARGGVAYDGMRSRFEVLFQTTARPEGFVEGEFFRVGVNVTTGDGGGNSVIVRAIVWQLKCKNLLVIDQCAVPVAQLRHVGTEMQLAKRFEHAFSKALDALSPFLAAWNYARVDDVIEAARGTTETPIPVDSREAIRGIFAGLIERKAITPPKLDTKRIVDDLVAAWERDDSSATSSVATSRAAIVNAITAAAHTWELTPWQEDELQSQAGVLLWGKAPGRKPAPLVWVEPEQVLEAPAQAAALA
jgi:hypothetical protein